MPLLSLLYQTRQCNSGNGSATAATHLRASQKSGRKSESTSVEKQVRTSIYQSWPIHKKHSRLPTRQCLATRPFSYLFLRKSRSQAGLGLAVWLSASFRQQVCANSTSVCNVKVLVRYCLHYFLQTRLKKSVCFVTFHSANKNSICKFEFVSENKTL